MDLVTVIFLKICCPKDVWNICDIAEYRFDIQLFGDLSEQVSGSTVDFFGCHCEQIKRCVNNRTAAILINGQCRMSCFGHPAAGSTS